MFPLRFPTQRHSSLTRVGTCFERFPSASASVGGCEDSQPVTACCTCTEATTVRHSGRNQENLTGLELGDVGLVIRSDPHPHICKKHPQWNTRGVWVKNSRSNGHIRSDERGCSRLYSPCSSSLPLSSEKCPLEAVDGLLVPLERPFPKYSEPLSIIPGISALKLPVFQLLCRDIKCQQELKGFSAAVRSLPAAPAVSLWRSCLRSLRGICAPFRLWHVNSNNAGRSAAFYTV